MSSTLEIQRLIQYCSPVGHAFCRKKETGTKIESLKQDRSKLCRNRHSITWVRTEGRRLVRAESSDIGSPIHQFPPDTLPLHYFSDTDSEPISPQMEKATPRTTKTLEKLVRKATDQYAYHESPDSDIQLPAKLHDKFSATDFPKFKPIDDPRFHFKGFRANMTIKGVDPILYPKDTATWEDITHAFMTHYKGNTKASTSLWELEILKQTEKEGFTAYLTQWKDLATQMVNTPSEKEMVKIFVSNLQPKYRNHLRYLGLETFDNVYHIRIEIEDDLLKANDNNNNGSNNNKEKLGYSNNKKTDTPSSSKGVNTVEINDKSKGAISPIGPTADPPAERRSPKWDLNKYCKYHQGKGHTIEECWTLKNKQQDMVESGQLPVPPGGKKPNTKTSPLTVLMIDAEQAPFDPVDYISPYTPLAVSHTQAYLKLVAEGLTAPMGTIPDPSLERRSASWDPAKYCDYHRGWGHATEECRKVRDMF
ncbi:Activity-regulated cytoskeleton-associated protein [Bienertia sinuspersici]